MIPSPRDGASIMSTKILIKSSAIGFTNFGWNSMRSIIDSIVARPDSSSVLTAWISVLTNIGRIGAKFLRKTLSSMFARKAVTAFMAQTLIIISSSPRYFSKRTESWLAKFFIMSSSNEYSQASSMKYSTHCFNLVSLFSARVPINFINSAKAAKREMRLQAVWMSELHC